MKIKLTRDTNPSIGVGGGGGADCIGSHLDEGLQAVNSW